MRAATAQRNKEMCLSATPIPGCAVIELPTYSDARGIFVKNYQDEQFRSLGLSTHFPEEFYTRSVEGVLRGIHFVTPPIDQVKVVSCIHGKVVDAIIDLRRGSPTFGKHLLFELSAERPSLIYIGKGIGHGFYVPSGEAILLYRVSTMYSPKHDCGIRWNSAGIKWPVENPIVSSRDRDLPTFEKFYSPFEFSEAER
jgi:dTDP-4-dehydrorhamnose 3,5-epimerase